MVKLESVTRVAWPGCVSIAVHVCTLGQGSPSFWVLILLSNQRVRLDRVYMSFSYSKVLSQCKFTNIYTHIFYLLYKQTTGQKTGIWVIWIPNTTLTFQDYSLPSNQVKPDAFSWLSRSYYHPTAFLILSPTHLHLSPLCSSLSPNAPTTLPPAFIHAVSELPSLSIIDLVVGGWWEASQILPADHMHVSCHQGCDALGEQVHVHLSQCPHRAQLSNFEYI